MFFKTRFQPCYALPSKATFCLNFNICERKFEIFWWSKLILTAVINLINELIRSKVQRWEDRMHYETVSFSQLTSESIRYFAIHFYVPSRIMREFTLMVCVTLQHVTQRHSSFTASVESRKRNFTFFVCYV